MDTPQCISYAEGIFHKSRKGFISLKKARRSVLFSGGREWIRTTEVVDGRFTVCSLWPLGNSPIFNFPPDCFFTVLTLTGFESDHSLHQGWSWWTDSNPRPADYKSAALPTELHQHFQRSNIIAYKTGFVKRNFCFFRTFSKVFYKHLRLWAAQRYDRSPTRRQTHMHKARNAPAQARA